MFHIFPTAKINEVVTQFTYIFYISQLFHEPVAMIRVLRGEYA